MRETPVSTDPIIQPQTSALARQIHDIRTRGLGFTLRKLVRNHLIGRRTSLILRRPPDAPVSRGIARVCRPEALRPVLAKDDWRFRRHLPRQETVLPELRANGAEVWMLPDDDGHAVGYICAAGQPYEDYHVYKYTYVPPPGGYYLFALMVAPSLRAYGALGARLMGGMIGILRDRCAAEGRALDCITAINDDNMPSLRLARSVGFAATGTVLHSTIVLGSTARLVWTREEHAAPPPSNSKTVPKPDRAEAVR